MNQEFNQPKMGSWRRGWLITKSSWRILLLDKELLAIPLISSVIGIIIIAIGYGGGALMSPAAIHHNGLHGWSYNTDHPFSHTTYAVWVAASALLALLSSYTIGAMIAMTLKRLRGGDPVLRDGYDAVKKHFGALSLFTLVSFGIITVLQRIEAYLPFAGKLLAFLGEIAWRVAAFFAIPVILDADHYLGPINATKQSVSLIKKTWKESSVNTFTMGSIFAVLIIVELLIGALLSAAAFTGIGTGLGVGAVVLTFLGLLLLILVSSAMDGIAKAVLYYYAVTGEAPAEFDRRLLHEAFTPKKARRLFS